jgi:hypothetical protein
MQERRSLSKHDQLMSFDNDIKRLIKTVDNIHRKQLPFAVSLALNEAAKDVKKGVERQLRADIDRPTPFTQKAFLIVRATKTNPTASVVIKDIQAKYLRYQIEGGKRKAKSSGPILIPRKGNQNKYGNLARGKLAKLKGQGKLVISNGLAFQKFKNKVTPIAYFADSAEYKKRFKFYERGIETANKVIVRHLRDSITKAIRTSK